jgi:histidinol-phosphate aminotransferase
VNSAENVVMVRTFSKMGLAALRIGWLYGPGHVIDAVNRLRGPFNVNVPAQVAGAAAVRDVAFTQKLKDYNAHWRDWLTAQLSSNRLKVLPSQGNFVLVLFPDEDGLRAKDAFEALGAKGLIVREMHSYGLPNALRISIGPEDAMRQCVEILKSFGAQGLGAGHV